LLNTSGAANTADGGLALIYNNTGSDNSAFGDRALLNNTSGSDNIALGWGAGFNLTTGDNNIDIGNEGVADESNTIRIGDPAVHESVFLAGIAPGDPEALNLVLLVNPITGQISKIDVTAANWYALPAVLFDYNSGSITISHWRRRSVQPGAAYCRDSDQQEQ
jgi:hypothetical protein